MAVSASAASYSGRGGSCRENPPRRAFSASSSCRWALSRRTMEARAAVPCVHHVGPANPPRTRAGRWPQWSRCAWVRTTSEIDSGSTGSGFQLRRRHVLSPWYRPQSTIVRRPSLSRRNLLPVTVPVAPRKVSVATMASSAFSWPVGVARARVCPLRSGRSGLVAHGRNGEVMLGGDGSVIRLVLQLLGGMNDGHGALSPVHDALAHRAEKEASEATAAASAHDHKAGALTLAYQGIHRKPANAVPAHLDIGVLVLPAGERLGDQGLLFLRELLPVDGPYGGGGGAFDVLQPPRVDDGQANSAGGRLLEGERDRVRRQRRTVNTDDDGSAGNGCWHVMDDDDGAVGVRCDLQRDRPHEHTTHGAQATGAD